MFTSVNIEGFRGVREGSVQGLAPISILVGPNNTGKSTVLEAIADVAFCGDARGIVGLMLRRGGTAFDALDRAADKGALLSMNSNEGGPWTTQISVYGLLNPDRLEESRRQGLRQPIRACWVKATHASGSISGNCYVDEMGRCSDNWVEGYPQSASPPRFVDVEAVRNTGALEDAYTSVDAAGRLPMVIKALAGSMKGLTDLRILKVESDFLLHSFFDGGPPVPTYLAGDGFKRFLAIAAPLARSPKGLVLLEEPESFQHPRYLRELAMLIHLAANEGTQIILSTHSLELIDLLLLSPEAEGKTYPAVHRMSLHDGKLRATTIDRDGAVAGRDGLLEDLRS